MTVSRRTAIPFFLLGLILIYLFAFHWRLFPLFGGYSPGTIPTLTPAFLRDALYRGADRVVLLSDRRFAGADTLATSYTLKCAIEKIGAYDLIFCGRQAIDGDMGVTAAQTARLLGWPIVSLVSVIQGRDAAAIRVERSMEEGRQVVDGPCIIDAEDTALAERRRLARDGALAVAAKLDRERGELVGGLRFGSSGFLFGDESHEILDEAKHFVETEFRLLAAETRRDRAAAAEQVRILLKRFLKKRLARYPLIIVNLIEE